MLLQVHWWTPGFRRIDTYGLLETEEYDYFLFVCIYNGAGGV